ncbi:MAG: hypothetical protein H0U23_15590 [Blastocatellia bacterium]|nr:hypothetical protein [Blastocatellia bacterium]
MKHLFVLAAAILISGCATSPTPTASARPVPAGRILAPEYFQSRSAQDVEVLVKRDSGLTGIANFTLLKVDGNPVAKLAAGEIARLYLPPGRHLLGAVPTVDPLRANSIIETEAHVSKDSPQLYRIYTAGGIIQIAPTSY